MILSLIVDDSEEVHMIVGGLKG